MSTPVDEAGAGQRPQDGRPELTSSTSTDTSPSTTGGSSSTTGPVETDAPVEEVPGTTFDPSDFVFDPTTVHAFQLSVSGEAIDSLTAEPTTWVEADLSFAGRTWSSVGLRLKGSSSFQTIDSKPALKIELDSYVDGQRFYGLERLTFNNEVWDPTMMAETMAYWGFRENGSPAPRTGYATITLNERYLGLYAIVETMDDDFVAANWDGEEGTLWEMTRECDFMGNCSCFEVQEPGENGVSDGIVNGCTAVSTGTLEALREAFDWDAVIGFMAVELGLNHPDSYTYNLNNFYVYHDPETDRLSLIPWGADSTFIYVHPNVLDNPNCDPLYLNTLVTSTWGWLTTFCHADEVCKEELSARILEVADWIEDSDLVGHMEANRDLLDPYAKLERDVNWTLDDREQRIGCFIEWTSQRPEELRVWAERL